MTLPNYITGEYAVGTECFSVTDNTRKEILGNAEGNRKIAIRTYYPVEKSCVQGLSKADIFSPKKLEAISKAFHVKDISDESLLKAEYYENAEHADGKFPLIMFSHGYKSYVEANTFLCCELASNGYIVASVGHAYEAVENDYEDGSFDLYDKGINKKMYDNMIAALFSQAKLLKAKLSPEEAAKRFDDFQKKHTRFIMERVPEWGKDIMCAADEVKRRYDRWLDLSKGIGASGHSLGGAAAYWLCHNCEEIACGVNIDGAIFGEYGSKIMKKPFLQICCAENYNVETRSLINSEAPVKCEVFEGMKHIGFTDAKFFIPLKSVVGKMDGEEMYKRLSKSHLDFFAANLKGNK